MGRWSQSLWAAPAAVGARTTIGSDVAALQKIQLTNNGGFYADVLNGGLDRLTILVQQLIEEQSRSLRVPFSDIAGGTEMANSVDRAGKVLGFDSSGRPAYTVPASGSAADVALQLASHITDLASTSTAKGAGLVGARRGVDYPFDSVGFLLVKNGDPVNVFKAFPSKAEVQASQNFTTTYDHTAILTDVLQNERSVYLPYGKFKTSAIIDLGSHPTSIFADPNSLWQVTDGNFIALRYNGAQRFKLQLGRMYGTNNASPLLTLVSIENAAAYFEVSGSEFSYAKKAVVMDGAYIGKLLSNKYSNCDTFVEFTAVSAPTADVVLANETYGTALFGTQPLIRIAAYGASMPFGYFETQNHAKLAVDVQTGDSVTFDMRARMFNTGEIRWRSGTSGRVHVNALACYDTSTNRFIRVDGGAELDISHSRIVNTSLISSSAAVSASGDLVGHGVLVDKYATGISLGGTYDIEGGTVRNCTTGISALGGEGKVSEVLFSGNTTDITKNASCVYIKTIQGSAVYDPPSLADGAGTTTTVTVTGAVLGDFVRGLSFTRDLQGITLTGYVSAADTVSVRFQNETGGAIDLASGTLSVRVGKV